jgi:hypothetical protein
VLHANADEWATGPFASVAGGVDVDVDVLTTMCWPGPDVSVPGIRALRSSTQAKIAAYVLALPPKTTLVEEWQRYLAEGAGELHIYHAGLASQARLDAVTQAVQGIQRNV